MTDYPTIQQFIATLSILVMMPVGIIMITAIIGKLLQPQHDHKK